MSQGFCVLAKLGLAAAVWRDSLPDLHVGAVDLLLSYLWGLAVARAFLLFHNTDRTASNPQWREGLHTLGSGAESASAAGGLGPGRIVADSFLEHWLPTMTAIRYRG